MFINPEKRLYYTGTSFIYKPLFLSQAHEHPREDNPDLGTTHTNI